MRKQIKIKGEVVADSLIRYTKETYDKLRKSEFVESLSLEEGNIRLRCEVSEVRGVWDVENYKWMPGEHTEADLRKCVNYDYDIPTEDIISVVGVDYLNGAPIEHLELGEKVVKGIEEFDESRGIGWMSKTLAALFLKSEVDEFSKDCAALIGALEAFSQRYKDVMNVGPIFNNDNFEDLFEEFKEKEGDITEVLTDLQDAADTLRQD